MDRFQAPQYLYLLWVLPAVAGATWFSRSLSSRRSRITCAAVRSLIVSVIVIALGRPVIERTMTRSFPPVMVFLHDVSRSTGVEEKDARNLQAGLARELPGEAVEKAIFFAASPTTTPGPDSPRRETTDIEAAIDFGSATAGQSRNVHLILLTDGRLTSGDAIAAALRARSSGGEVSVVPIGRKVEGVPAIVNVQPPDDARIGVATHILTRVRMPRAGEVTLSLLNADGSEISATRARVTSEQVIALPLQPQRRGQHRMRVVLSGAGDAASAAASADVLFHVAGPPSVLICDPEPLGVQPLKAVIERLKFDVRIEPPSEFALTDGALDAFDAVIISDWPGPDASAAALRRLRRFIEDGGSLIFIGGSRVSSKSWRSSALEALLPVDFAPEIARVVEKPLPVHVCFVLDVSGSMMSPLGTDASGQPVSKFNMLKQAVLDSLGELPATAVVSIVVFDNNYTVVVNRVPIRDRKRIIQIVRDLQIGGGTNMVPAMRVATDILKGTSIARFMILLTDGVSAENPDRALAQQIRNSDIDLTAIAVGADSNQAMMEALANGTYGRYVYCGDASSIPRVFVKQARAIKTMSVVPRKPFRPQPGPQPDMIAGLTNEPWPILDAAIPAAVKTSSDVEVALLTDEKQPLLAAWTVGLAA